MTVHPKFPGLGCPSASNRFNPKESKLLSVRQVLVLQLEANLAHRSGCFPSVDAGRSGAVFLDGYISGLETVIPGSVQLARSLFSSLKDLHFKETEEELRITLHFFLKYMF